MAEKKQVLFEVKAEMDKALEKLGELEIKMDSATAKEKQFKDELAASKKVINEQEAAIRAAAQAQNEGAISLEEYSQRFEAAQAIINAETAAMSKSRAQMVEAREQRKALSKEIGEQSRVVQNAIIAEDTYKGTLKGLAAELSVAKDKLRAMNMESDPKAYAAQSEYVGKLNEQMKELEFAYGVHTRDVGNYGQTTSKTATQVELLVREMLNLKAAGKENSEEFQNAQKQLQDFSKATATANHNTLEFANNGLGSAMGAMAVMQKLMGADTAEGKKMAELMQKAQIAVVGLSAVTKIYQAFEKKGLTQKIAYNLQVKLAVANIKKEAASKTAEAATTTAATIAQEGLNTAMKANPIGLIVAAVMALVAGLVALVSWLVKSTAAQREANKAQEEFERLAKRHELALASLDAKEAARANALKIRHNAEIQQMVESGATTEEITRKKEQFEAEELQSSIATIQEKIKQEGEYAKKAEANYKAQQKLLKELVIRKGADAKATKEQADKAAAAYNEMLAAQTKVADHELEISNIQLQVAENTRSRSQALADKAYQRAVEHLDNYQRMSLSLLSRSKDYWYNDALSAQENAALKFKAEQEYNARVYEQTYKYEVEKLKMQRKNGKITKEQYKELLAALKIERDNFYVEQLNEVTEYNRQLIESAVQLAGGKSVEGQISDVRAQYKEAVDAITNDATMAEDEKAFYIKRLNEKLADEIRAIRISGEDSTAKAIEQRISDSCRDDLRRYTGTEEQRVELEIEMQKRIIAEKKKAGLKTYADEAKLAGMEADLRLVTANKELQIAWQNADKQYQIKKDYIEKELELANLSFEQRAALEEELANITAEQNARKVESVESYSAQALDILSGMNDLINNLGSAQVQKYEKENQQKKDSLDKQLKAGLISQKKYDKEVAAADEELAAKKAKIERQQAIRAKALSAMEIAVNTAVAIMKIWAEVPKMDFGVSTGVLTALAATTGALQLAAVLAEPLPTARQGGLVKGPKHEQGGVLVNTEGDERIISSRPSKAFPEMLNLISYIGKHGGIPETGFAGRNAYGYPGAAVNDANIQATDYDLLANKFAEKMSEAVRQISIYTSLQELKDAQAEQDRIINSAKL